MVLKTQFRRRSTPLDQTERNRQGQQAATDPRLIPPPIDPSTSPLKPPDIVQLEQLPAQARTEKEEQIRQVLAQTANLAQQGLDMEQMPQTASQGVADAIAGRNIRKLDIVDDIQAQATPSTTGHRVK